MRLYFILIQKDQQQNIVKIKLPDFANIELSGDKLIDVNQSNSKEESLKKIVSTLVSQQFKSLQKNAKPIPDPKSFEELSKIKKDTHETWTPILVDAEPSQGFVSRWLPRLGGLAAVVSAVAGTVVSTVALKYALRDSKNKNSATAYSIFQSTINNAVGLIIYFYANSGRGLAKFGQKIDEFIASKFSSHSEDTTVPHVETINCKTKTTLFLIKTLCSGIVISNVGSNAIASLEQLNALANQLVASADQNDLIIPAKLLNICIMVLIVTGGISGLSFVGTMVAQLANDLEKYIKSHRPHYSFETDNNSVHLDHKPEEKSQQHTIKLNITK